MTPTSPPTPLPPPPASPRPLITVIPRSTSTTSDEPRLLRGVPSNPVYLPGAGAHWPACQAWNWEFFASHAGHVVVPVSLSNEEATATVKTHMPLSQFIGSLRRRYKGSIPSSPPSSSTPTHRPPSTGPTALAQTPYVKQLDLALLVDAPGPALRFDRLFQSQFLSWLRTPRPTATFIWLGDQGSVTGLHNDDEHTVMLCVQGYKRVTVYPPDQGHLLYVNPKYDSGTRCCAAVPDSPTAATDFPLLAHATPAEVVIGPGDLLFIPKHWFHCVRSLAPSISLNVFLSTVTEDVVCGTPRRVLELLHNAGLYKSKANCVCHAAPVKQPPVSAPAPLSPPPCLPTAAVRFTRWRTIAVAVVAATVCLIGFKARRR